MREKEREREKERDRKRERVRERGGALFEYIFSGAHDSRHFF